MHTATNANAIVSSLFPEQFHERLIAEAEEKKARKELGKKDAFRVGAKAQLENFLDNSAGGARGSAFETKPIAELFLHTTLMVADIEGFTAWCSAREPSQIFVLLETVFHAFDQFARKRKVFKVETVGDCYVAVAGVPNPRDDHALVMARFARDCLNVFNRLLTNLEITLGPDTADMKLRVG